MLSAFKFNISLLDQEKGAYAYWMDTLDIYGYGETPEEALDSLVEDLIMYAKGYIDNPARYSNAPNRQHHLPYILKVMLCNSAGEVKQMLLEDAS